MSRRLGKDAFDRLASRSTTFDDTTRSFTAGYTNNRKSFGGYGDGVDFFDAAGNVTYNRASSTPIDERIWKYDAVGRVSDWTETSYYAGDTHQQQGEILTFDGDGRTAKRLKKRLLYSNPPNPYYETPEYYTHQSPARSSLNSMGQVKPKRKTSTSTVR